MLSARLRLSAWHLDEILGLLFGGVVGDTDESNPASKLLLHILAAVAQFEWELIRERVSAGMKAAKTHGTR